MCAAYSGSAPRVLLEYYAGCGLQIQPLANFGKANAAWSSCRGRGDRTCTKLRQLLDAMIALGSARRTFTVWEGVPLPFEGGAPPWMSGMAQGTGIQALPRAYALTGVTRYRDAATAALAAFETAPPVGVARPATNGTHYLMYSYAPDLFIFNGFLQSLVGLDDYRDITRDTRGTTLFRAGTRTPAGSSRSRTPARGRCTPWPGRLRRSSTTRCCATSWPTCAGESGPTSTARPPTAPRST